MWNIQKSGLGKMLECVCVRARASARVHVVCVKTLKNSSFCISGIIRTIELKFGVHLKQTQLFLDFMIHTSFPAV